MRLNHSQIFIKEAQMQEKHLYEYSVIRVVPKRVSVSSSMWIIVFAKAKFIKMLYTIDVAKMELFSGDLDLETGVKPRVLQKIAHGTKQGGPIAQFDIHLVSVG
jgi:hypothetical protein